MCCSDSCHQPVSCGCFPQSWSVVWVSPWPRACRYALWTLCEIVWRWKKLEGNVGFLWGCSKPTCQANTNTLDSCPGASTLQVQHNNIKTPSMGPVVFHWLSSSRWRNRCSPAFRRRCRCTLNFPSFTFKSWSWVVNKQTEQNHVSVRKTEGSPRWKEL